MKLFRVSATVGRSVNGWWRTRQVPTFVLEREVHGLRTEAEAEAFAEQMLKDLLDDESAAASACAVEI